MTSRLQTDLGTVDTDVKCLNCAEKYRMRHHKDSPLIVIMCDRRTPKRSKTGKVHGYRGVQKHEPTDAWSGTKWTGKPGPIPR